VSHLTSQASDLNSGVHGEIHSFCLTSSAEMDLKTSLLGSAPGEPARDCPWNVMCTPTGGIVPEQDVAEAGLMQMNNPALVNSHAKMRPVRVIVAHEVICDQADGQIAKMFDVRSTYSAAFSYLFQRATSSRINTPI
jgi:hypothetical protein